MLLRSRLRQHNRKKADLLVGVVVAVVVVTALATTPSHCDAFVQQALFRSLPVHFYYNNPKGQQQQDQYQQQEQQRSLRSSTELPLKRRSSKRSNKNTATTTTTTTTITSDDDHQAWIAQGFQDETVLQEFDDRLVLTRNNKQKQTLKRVFDEDRDYAERAAAAERDLLRRANATAAKYYKQEEEEASIHTTSTGVFFNPRNDDATAKTLLAAEIEQLRRKQSALLAKSFRRGGDSNKTPFETAAQRLESLATKETLRRYESLVVRSSSYLQEDESTALSFSQWTDEVASSTSSTSSRPDDDAGIASASKTALQLRDVAALGLTTMALLLVAVAASLNTMDHESSSISLPLVLHQLRIIILQEESVQQLDLSASSLASFQTMVADNLGAQIQVWQETIGASIGDFSKRSIEDAMLVQLDLAAHAMESVGVEVRQLQETVLTEISAAMKNSMPVFPTVDDIQGIKERILAATSSSLSLPAVDLEGVQTSIRAQAQQGLLAVEGTAEAFRTQVVDQARQIVLATASSVKIIPAMLNFDDSTEAMKESIRGLINQAKQSFAAMTGSVRIPAVVWPTLDVDGMDPAIRAQMGHAQQSLLTAVSGVTLPSIDTEGLIRAIQDLVDRSQHSFAAWSASSMKMPSIPNGEDFEGNIGLIRAQVEQSQQTVISRASSVKMPSAVLPSGVDIEIMKESARAQVEQLQQRIATMASSVGSLSSSSGTLDFDGMKEAVRSQVDQAQQSFAAAADLSMTIQTSVDFEGMKEALQAQVNNAQQIILDSSNDMLVQLDHASNAMVSVGLEMRQLPQTVLTEISAVEKVMPVFPTVDDMEGMKERLLAASSSISLPAVDLEGVQTSIRAQAQQGLLAVEGINEAFRTQADQARQIIRATASSVKIPPMPNFDDTEAIFKEVIRGFVNQAKQSFIAVTGSVRIPASVLPTLDVDGMDQAIRAQVGHTQQSLLTAVSGVTLPSIDTEGLIRVIQDLVDRSQQSFAAWSASCMKMPSIPNGEDFEGIIGLIRAQVEQSQQTVISRASSVKMPSAVLPSGVDIEIVKESARAQVDQLQQRIATMASSVGSLSSNSGILDFDEMNEAVRSQVDQAQQSFAAASASSINIPMGVDFEGMKEALQTQTHHAHQSVLGFKVSNVDVLPSLDLPAPDHATTFVDSAEAESKGASRIDFTGFVDLLP